jgi:hypothetical protein
MDKTVDSTIIGTFNKQRIAAIVPELMRQKATKRDFIAGASRMTVRSEGDALRLALADVKTFAVQGADGPPRYFSTWADAEKAATAGERIEVLDGTGEMELTRTAARQLCGTANVPVDTVERFAREGQADLAAYALNERLRRPRRGIDTENAEAFSGKYLVRTLDGKCRAILSPSYRILDTVDLFFSAAEEFEKAGAEPWQMRLWDDGFQFMAVSKGISGEVRTDRTFDPGDGWSSRWANLGGDTQFAAITITNSETGGGSLNVAPAVMTRVCCNFNVWAKVYRGIHIQKRREDEGFISAEAEAAESRAIWLRVRDNIRGVFDAEKFKRYIDKMNGATQVALGEKVEETTRNVLGHFDISEDRQQAILRNLIESRDYSKYGLAQAATYTAHAADKSGDESYAADLEALGSDIIDMPAGEFKQMLVTA